HCRGSDLHEIDVELSGHAQGFLQAHDAQRLVLGSVQTDLGGHDFPVQAVRAFFTLAAVTKVGSDGCFLGEGRLMESKAAWRPRGGTGRAQATAGGNSGRAPCAQALDATVSATNLEKVSRGMTPRSLLPRARTATAPAAFSLSPTTAMKGSFCNACSRILYVIFSLRRSVMTLSP